MNVEEVPGLRRTLGLPSLTFYGVGLILGAGVYSILGAAAGRAGPALWQSFLLGAVTALLTGLSYAELATSPATCTSSSTCRSD